MDYNLNSPFIQIETSEKIAESKALPLIVNFSVNVSRNEDIPDSEREYTITVTKEDEVEEKLRYVKNVFYECNADDVEFVQSCKDYNTILFKESVTISYARSQEKYESGDIKIGRAELLCLAKENNKKEYSVMKMKCRISTNLVRANYTDFASNSDSALQELVNDSQDAEKILCFDELISNSRILTSLSRVSEEN